MSYTGKKETFKDEVVKSVDNDLALNFGIFKLTVKGRLGFYICMGTIVSLLIAFIVYMIVLVVTGSNVPTTFDVNGIVHAQ